MRKMAVTILILGAAWIGYTAWPIYDLLLLVRAIEHDRDHLANFCKFGIWYWQVRGVSAGLVAAAAAVPSHVPALAVALATRRGHPTGDHSELTRR
jgi:hypothetical protein